VVWFDRPWLGESPGDIHNLLNCPFNYSEVTNSQPFSAKTF
jgi:hypothetical protein